MNVWVILLASVLLLSGCIGDTVQEVPNPPETTSLPETTTAPETTTVVDTTSVSAIESSTIPASTTSKPAVVETSTTTSTTSTTTPSTSTTIPPAQRREVSIEKSGDYSVVFSFTAVDGKKHSVRLDSGPFDVKDEFFLKGRLYKYEKQEYDEENNLKVELRDVTSFDKVKYALAPKTGEKITLETYSFLDASENDDEIELEPEADAQDSSVYSGDFAGLPVLSDGGSLYLGVDGVSKNRVGVIPEVFGSGEFTDVQMQGDGFGLKVVGENGKNLNGAKGDVTDDDGDDVFIVIHERAFSEKYFYLDFYDRNYLKKDITNSFKMASSMADSNGIGKTFYDMDTPAENYISDFPVILYKYNITYGGGNEITKVTVYA